MVFIVLTNYFTPNLIGVYSSLLNARNAIRNLTTSDSNIIKCEDTGNYTYQITTRNGEYYWAEIAFEEIDSHFD